MSENDKWLIKLERKADKQLTKLAPKDRARVLNSIKTLARADNPAIESDVKHIEGSNPKQWRQRQGDYRIIFSIELIETFENRKG